MQLKPTSFGEMFLPKGRWILNLDSHSVSLSKQGSDPAPPQCFNLSSIQDLNLEVGIMWHRLTILVDNNRSYTIDAFRSTMDKVCSILRDYILEEAVHRAVKAAEKGSVQTKLVQSLELNVYFRNLHKRRLLQDNEIIKIAAHRLVGWGRLNAAAPPVLKNEMKIIAEIDFVVENRNQDFINREVKIFAPLFDTIESTPLTHEQRIACVTLDDANILQAPAGSGKTSSLVGKLGYLLSKQLYKPEEILILSYNKSVTSELEDRLQNKLSALLNGSHLVVHTFHGMAQKIIAENECVKPTIADVAGDYSDAQRIYFGNLIKELSRADSKFSRLWLSFSSLYLEEIQPEPKFITSKEYITLNGESVKSFGEYFIANWLYLEGIEYKYEEPYKFHTASPTHRQYKPDFYFPKLNCYLEHFAFEDIASGPKRWSAKEISDYLESVKWKRETHRTCHTCLLETKHSELVDNSIVSSLRKSINKRIQDLQGGNNSKIVFSKPTDAEIQKKIESLNELLANRFISKVIIPFIRHAKAVESWTKEVTPVDKKAGKFNPREQAFLDVIALIIEEYNKKLSAAGEIDFEDLIKKGAYYARAVGAGSGYKCILVDEFQDISHARKDLLLALLKQNEENTISVVGDPQQSIYRFSGSDPTILNSFAAIFGHSSKLALTKTFRSNQGISDIAGIVSKSSLNVVAEDLEFENVIELRIDGDLHGSLNKLNSEAKEKGQFFSVFLLARTNKQLRGIAIEGLNHLNIEFLTIHKAKGLQADYVFLVGLGSDFPSQIENDPLLNLIVPCVDGDRYDEERRLFYVALTRARHRVVLFPPSDAAGLFVKELIELSETRKEILVFGELKNESLDIFRGRKWDGKSTTNHRKYQQSPFLHSKTSSADSPSTTKIRKKTKIDYKKILESKRINSFVVIDFETTGLSPTRGARIIEIAALKIVDEKIIGEYQTLVNPGVRIPAEISEINGITNGMLRDSPSPEVAMRELHEFIGNSILVAHNASFDQRFLVAESQKLGIQVQNEFICTLSLARSAYPDLSNHKLKTLINELGLLAEGPIHRAKTDTQATAELFLRIVGLVQVDEEVGNTDSILSQPQVISFDNNKLTQEMGSNRSIDSGVTEDLILINCKICRMQFQSQIEFLTHRENVHYRNNSTIDDTDASYHSVTDPSNPKRNNFYVSKGNSLIREKYVNYLGYSSIDKDSGFVSDDEDDNS